MIPSIALVGRPNVGKSTLFNRLTRTRNALVADFPGLTRDRQYGKAKWQGQAYIAIDTGGLEGEEAGVDELMAQQSFQAAQEADIVFFLVDTRAGLTSADEMIAQSLRNLQKPVYLLANKSDGIDADSACAEFYQLGFGDVHQIAAAHGRGINRIIENALEPWLEKHAPEQDDITQDESVTDAEISTEELPDEHSAERYKDLPIKVAIVGRPNVGKSTLTNRILGEDRVVVYDMPGTTRDSVYIPFERNDQKYIIIDTAGIRRRKNIKEVVEKFSIVKTLQAIDDANVVLFLVDARQDVTDQDLTLLGHVLNAGRSVVIVINKWDGLESDARDAIKKELDRRLGFVDFARIHFISALHGSGVGLLYKSIHECFESATRRVNTAMLTRLMQTAQEEHTPPMVNGRRIKLKYAHAGGYNPPRIVIHGNQVKGLPDTYKRYLINYFRKSLKVMGTPIHLEFQETENPFAGQKNKLTQSQVRKRKRMMKFVKKR